MINEEQIFNHFRSMEVLFNGYGVYASAYILRWRKDHYSYFPGPPFTARLIRNIVKGIEGKGIRDGHNYLRL